jgi:hypothetical protein
MIVALKLSYRRFGSRVENATIIAEPELSLDLLYQISSRTPSQRAPTSSIHRRYQGRWGCIAGYYSRHLLAKFVHVKGWV